MTSEEKQNLKLLRREKLRTRITEIDLLRGIAVFLMVFDHIMVDLWYFLPELFVGFPGTNAFWGGLVRFAIWWWEWPVRIYVRYVIVFIFLALTGVSCSFSKSNFKRGFMLMGVSLALTLATFILGRIMGDPDVCIVFGILHLISLSIIIISAIELITKNKWVFLVIGAAMMTAGAFLLKEEEVLFSDGPFLELFFKTFIGLTLLGPDSYSFLFYGGQIFIGVFLGKLLYPNRKPLLFKKGYSDNPVTFTGRHSLIVYLAHQVIVPVILSLLALMSGFTLGF